MVKIKLTCSWCDDKSLFERFKRVYISEKNFNSNYSFTSDNDFDFLVIINGPRQQIYFSKEKTIGVIMEPSNSPTVHMYRPYLESVCGYILWHHKVDSSQYIYYPGLLPYHMDYKEGENLDYFLNNNFKKNKLCSLITSYNEENSFSSCIYQKRVNFVKKILNTDLDIDIYGNNWESSGILDKRLKGTLENKKQGLLNYKFSIAMENCREENYFTEKITDCILTDTIPIYHGCPNIDNFFEKIPVLSNLENINDLFDILNKKHFLNDKSQMATRFNLYTAIIKFLQKKYNL